MENKDYIIHVIEGQYGGLHGIESWTYVEQEKETYAFDTAREEEIDLINTYALDEEYYGDEDIDEDMSTLENYLDNFGSASIVYELNPKYKEKYSSLDKIPYEELEEIAEKYGTIL